MRNKFDIYFPFSQTGDEKAEASILFNWLNSPEKKKKELNFGFVWTQQQKPLENHR